MLLHQASTAPTSLEVFDECVSGSSLKVLGPLDVSFFFCSASLRCKTSLEANIRIVQKPFDATP